MKIYNTLTRKKEEFVPQSKEQIKIYVCGPTVYNYFHIGNARPFVVFDTLRRYLEYKGENVTYVQNFTDVDDKIINKAREEKTDATSISNKFIEEYFKDAKALNIKKATIHPKVTESMGVIISFIQKLIDKGYAYQVGGDVYYSTTKFDGYGKLSRQNVEELKVGARIEAGEKKQDPLDFALWKARKTDDEIAWESPWGMGRPGWHIECSAMSKEYLGETIDLHAGGQDLIFPHHENEIAQSEAANGKPFANYWMHNGYITINNEKMSKSKGNFFTVRDILKEYSGEVIRFYLLSAHYRSPVNFSDTLIQQAKNGLERMENAKGNLKHLIATGSGSITEQEAEALKSFDEFRQDFVRTMEDDLNTADAISAIFELITAINTRVKSGTSKEFAQKSLDLFMELTSVLGLLQAEEETAVNEQIQALIALRQEARKNKDFAKADQIRDQLKEQGITLKDTPRGVQIIRE